MKCCATEVVVPLDDDDLEEHRGREHSPEESQDGGIWCMRSMLGKSAACHNLDHSK